MTVKTRAWNDEQAGNSGDSCYPRSATKRPARGNWDEAAEKLTCSPLADRFAVTQDR
jgi:hypothetical protein